MRKTLSSSGFYVDEKQPVLEEEAEFFVVSEEIL